MLFCAVTILLLYLAVSICSGCTAIAMNVLSLSDSNASIDINGQLTRDLGSYVVLWHATPANPPLRGFFSGPRWPKQFLGRGRTVLSYDLVPWNVSWWNRYLILDHWLLWEFSLKPLIPYLLSVFLLLWTCAYHYEGCLSWCPSGAWCFSDITKWLFRVIRSS